MSATFEFEAQTRTDNGKAVARRMRRDQDLVPAVVYGAGKAPQAITIPHKDVFHAFENEAVFSHILKLSVDGKEERVVIKDVQRHAYKPKILHVDFFRVSMKEKITMHVPIHFEGEEEAPGIKDQGGQYTKSITDVEIRCLPADLPEFIPLDVSKMELDQTLHLSDIRLPTNVEFALHAELDEEHDHPVISCHLPKVTQEDIEAEQHEAELAEEAAAESAAEEEAAEAAEEEAEAEGKPEEASEEGEETKKDAE